MSIVVLSGGMDSTTLLWDTLATYPDEKVETVSFNYGQRHARELDCARRLAACRRIPHHELDISALKVVFAGSSQTTTSIPVPEGRYDAPSMKTTVVPNRNMIMLALAAGLAIARHHSWIAYGAHSGDHAIYPDCRPEFVSTMSAALGRCHYPPGIRLWVPYLNNTKGQICKRGLELGVPYRLTWTCYAGLERPCGKCGACVERAEAFAFANVQDPLLEVE